MSEEKPTVTITRERFDELEKTEAHMSALEAAGVDNWEGYSVAYSYLVEWGWGVAEDE